MSETRTSREDKKRLTVDERQKAREIFEDYFRHTIYWTDKMASMENLEEVGKYDLGYLGIRLSNDLDALLDERDALVADVERLRTERRIYRRELGFYLDVDELDAALDTAATPAPEQGDE